MNRHLWQAKSMGALVAMIWCVAPTVVRAQLVTPYAACEAHLNATGAQAVELFSDCFDSQLIALSSSLDAPAERAARAVTEYEALARTADNYMVSATNCAAERAFRQQLESQAITLGDATRELRNTIEVLLETENDANRLRLWGAERGLVIEVTLVAAAMSDSLYRVALERDHRSYTDTLNDVRGTDVENRCGSAEPIPDPPTPEPIPAPQPEHSQTK